MLEPLEALQSTEPQPGFGAVLEHIGTRPDVTGKVGTTGYCMGGNASFRSATIFGDQLAAAFHAGGLVPDEPASPHLRAKAIKS